MKWGSKDWLCGCGMACVTLLYDNLVQNKTIYVTNGEIIV